jgi:anti-anti-sigma factor
MRINASIKDSTAVIHLTGRLDSTTYRSLRAGCDELLQLSEISILEVDVHDVEHINSSAIGMLLLIHELAQKNGKQLHISNLRGFVLSVFEVANLHRYFTIVPANAGLQR